VILGLEHIGSTAVPGLVAKPIVDILGGYPRGAGVQSYIAALKIELARKYPRDREAYTEGKTSFVQQVVADALASP
jgi:GrpB-like predicted nucleotidyltransferase (UPF0157 family)